jgi:hypothetical protein
MTAASRTALGVLLAGTEAAVGFDALPGGPRSTPI